MQHPGMQPHRTLGALALGLWFGCFPALASAGTTGKLSGVVLDAQKHPVVAATVSLVGQPFGGFTDAKGQYTILNIPAGTYVVRINRVGFKQMMVENTIISSDNTTRLDATLQETKLTTETVVVKAQRPPVEVNLTSTRATLTSKEIATLPVQELQDVVNLQAGVVDGHFRGGRTGEVQYQVDGVSVNNVFNNVSGVRVDRSLLQEVQVISGTFDAEYGQAMSGVVNAVLKQGTEKFAWNAEVFSGGFVFPGREGARLTTDKFSPSALQNYMLSLTGPLPIPHTVGLVSGRYSTTDGYVYATRRFLPTDTFDPEHLIFIPTGNGAEVPLATAEEWSGAVKLTNTSIDRAKLSYQALFSDVDAKRGDFTYRFNPDGLPLQHTFSISHGFDWTQTLSNSTFLNVALRQNYLKYTDRVYEDLYDPRYDAAGPPKGDPSYENGAIIHGVNFTRFEQETNAYLLKSSIVSQVTHENQVKGGIELQSPTVSFGSPGTLDYTTINGVQTLVRHVDDPPDFPGVRTYRPRIGAGFLQDQMERGDLTVRIGARVDYFDANTTVPSDLANPANAIAGAPQSVPTPTSTKVTVAPRLGVAYPIGERTAVHFAYGHFYQFPAIGDIFANADYSVLARLQAGGISYGVLGNPDVRPEKTIQYEFGFKEALNADLGFDVSLFYKDIRDLLGTQFVSTYNGAEYARLANSDFGNVIGFTISVDQRRLGPADIALDYTWQMAKGNSSDPRETATRAEAGEDPRPRVVPFNWDQHHTFNFTLGLSSPGVYSASAILRAGSGQPYTPELDAGFGNGLETNSARKPFGVVIDLRAERRLGIGSGNLNLFGRIFNLTDTRFFNGPVFSSTGSPYYSRFPVPDAAALEDPTRFYPPRRIEIGLTYGAGL